MSKSNLKRVQGLVKKYARVMGLQHYDISVEISKEYDDGNGGAANCCVNNVYEWAIITFYRSAFSGRNDIVGIVKHELAHLLTEELYLVYIDLINGRLRTHDDVNSKREQLTERIARIV